MLLMQYVLRLKAGALAFAGVPCNTHVWISRASTGRTPANPLGDCSQPGTRIGNAIAARWSLAMLVCIVRQAVWSAEQPGTSLLPRINFVRQILQINLHAFGLLPGSLIRLPLSCNYCTPYPTAFCKAFQSALCDLSWMGAYGCRNLKRSMLFGNVSAGIN